MGGGNLQLTHGLRTLPQPRRREPENLDVPIESPRTFRKMVEELYGVTIDVSQYALAMDLRYSHAEALLAGFDGRGNALPEGSVIQFPKSQVE